MPLAKFSFAKNLRACFPLWYTKFHLWLIEGRLLVDVSIIQIVEIQSSLPSLNSNKSKITINDHDCAYYTYTYHAIMHVNRSLLILCAWDNVHSFSGFSNLDYSLASMFFSCFFVIIQAVSLFQHIAPLFEKRPIVHAFRAYFASSNNIHNVVSRFSSKSREHLIYFPEKIQCIKRQQ